MPSKRTRSSSDSDDEDVEIESASSSFRQTAPGKRSRLVSAVENEGSSGSDDEEQGIQNEFLITPGPSGQDDEAEDNEELFATQLVEKQIRRLRDNVASENGIIEEVYCSNFMCHSKLRIRLGPLINFIVGHNGSGKSAVLTALTMCLGGKATATNRGASLKSMIKEGEDSAVLAVKIKNAGEGAYKSEQYGTSISVERHFSRSGSSGFKIKNAESKIITTKKADLDDILDFFAFQLDNPINVLNQDMARQFLSNSSPSDKYKFFIRGTQLEVLDADYKVVEENIDNIEAKLHNRTEDNAVLKAKADAAEQKKRFLEQAKSIRDKIEETRRMHAWAQVEEQERTLEAMAKELVKAGENVNEKKDAAEDATGVHEGHHQAWEAAKRQWEQLKDDRTPLQEKHDAAKEKFDANTKEILKLKESERQIKGHMKSHKDNMKQYDGEILKEEQRLADAEGGEQAERVERLQALKEAADQVKREQQEHDEGFHDLDRRRVDAEQSLAESKPALKNASDALGSAQKQLNDLQRSEGRPLDPYAPQMVNLVKAVNAETRWGEEPVGPLGTHVRLLEMKWSSVIETTFGQNLAAFACTSQGDRKLLEAIMRRLNFHVPILSSKADRIDVTKNEPREDLLTILRVLHIDNDLVRNQMIIHQAIENVVLASSTEEAIGLIQNKEPKVKAAICLGDQNGGARYALTGTGNAAGGPVRAWRGAARMKADREEQLRLQRENVSRAARDKQEAEQRDREVTAHAVAARQAVQRHKRVKNDLIVKIQHADDAVDELQNEIESNQPQDGKLQELRRLRKVSQDEYEHTSASYQDWIDAKDKLDDAARPLKDTMDAAWRELETAITRADKKETRVGQLDQVRESALRRKNEAIAKVDTATRDKDDRATAVDEKRQEVQVEFVAAAEQICQRVEVSPGMTPGILDKRLEQFEIDLRHQQSQAGGTEEDLTMAWEEAKRRYLEACAQTDEMEKFVKVCPTVSPSLCTSH